LARFAFNNCFRLSNKNSSVLRPLRPLFAEAPLLSFSFIFLAFFIIASSFSSYIDVLLGYVDEVVGNVSPVRILVKTTSAVSSPSTSTSVALRLMMRMRMVVRLVIMVVRVLIMINLRLIFINSCNDCLWDIFRLVDLNKWMLMAHSLLAGLTEVKVLADTTLVSCS
jgi:hypothetical protein